VPLRNFRVCGYPVLDNTGILVFVREMCGKCLREGVRLLVVLVAHLILSNPGTISLATKDLRERFTHAKLNFV